MDYLVYRSRNPIFTEVRCRGRIKHGQNGCSVSSEIKIVKVFTPTEWKDICTGEFMSPGGEIRYYKNGLLDREDGPALILADDTEVWYREGQPYTDNGVESPYCKSQFHSPESGPYALGKK